MATIENIILTDDLNAEVTEDVQTVTFYDPMTGVQREIELGADNRAAFESVLNEFFLYTEASRAVEVAPTKAAAHVKGKQAEIRAWAQANGYKIGDRGRIKAEIVNAYNAAHDEAGTSATDGIVDKDDLVEVESPQDDVDTAEPAVEVAEADTKVRPATEAELQDMLRQMALNGQEPTADDLIMAEVDTEADSK